MAVLKNRVGVSTVTTGTGTVSLGLALGAVAPHLATWQSLPAGGINNLDVVRYLILDSNGAWEYGLGTYSNAGSLTRAAGAMDGTIPGQKSSTGALLSLTGSAQVFITAIAEDIDQAPQHGRLIYVSATQLKFVPFGGDQIKIAGTLYTIPSAGVIGANTGAFVSGTAGQSLSSNTTYLVNLFNNNGTLTFDFTTGFGHNPDTAPGNVGVEVNTGNPTRTVIGLIRANSSGQFEEGATNMLVISWFNRRNKMVKGPSSGNATTSASYVELNLACRAFFVCWADDPPIVSAVGGVNAQATGTWAGSVGLDGTTSQLAADPWTNLLNGEWGATGGSAPVTSIIDGWHYVTPLGKSASGGSATVYVAASAVVRG